MRLRRLDLTRYGKFTDRSIDFGQRIEGEPDLHVIYGPNEAGKSTLFAGFLDLLFGIGTQSPFNFLHPYATMRIGGVLEFSGGARTFARLKRAQNSLLDADDLPVPEGAIRLELAGIERDAYRTMFSLDDETLEKGGESILASKGDLGQLLFSASAGLSHLSHQLLEIRGEADGFHKPRARSSMLAELKARLGALKAEREAFDTLASDHARLIETRDRSKALYEEALGERNRSHGRVEEIQRLLGALPRLAALRGLRARLVPLADVPEAPPGWAEDLRRLMKEDIELGIQANSLAAEIDRLAEEAGSILVDEAALRLTERVERLSELRARYVTAEKDLPERRLQLRQLDLSIAGILQRIERDGEADPRRLVLTAATTGRLRTLIEARSGIEAAMENAGRERAEAHRRSIEAAEALTRAGDDAASRPDSERHMAHLAVTVGALRTADHHIKQRHAERTLADAHARLAERLSALRPWEGTADALAALPCPVADTLQRWKSARRESEADLARHRSEIERLTTRMRHLEAECASFAAVTGVVTDREAAEVRARREEAWAAHRQALDAVSAQVFEVALRQDDVIGAGRVSHMSELAKLNQSRQALAVHGADLERSLELKTGAERALADLDAAIATTTHAMGPAFIPAPSLPDLEEWLARRERALDAREAARTAARDVHAAQADAEAATERLRAALARAGLPQEPDASFDALLATAQAALDRETERRRLRTDLDARQRDLAAREEAARQAEAEERRWADAWTATCQGCWLGEAPEVPAIAVVREVLGAVTELVPVIEKRASLVDRIEKMEKDQAAFRDEAMSLASALGLPAAGLPVIDTAQRIGETVKQALAESERRARTHQQLEAARGRRRALSESVLVHDGHKQRMTSFFGVESLAQVAEKLSETARRTEFREQAEEAEREILAAVRAPDLAAAEAALDAADRAALEAELADLRARLEDQDHRSHELFAAWSAARNAVEAIGSDGAAAAIEERRRTVLLEIEDGARRYLQLRAGVAATEQALAFYRERHRSSMMRRASAAFQTISRGAYAGLAAQPGKDGETLIALPAGGGSKAADELSKGTRFQLYLALRVAGYHEFVAARGAVPFVADDIMETFDDFRAEEAFRLFAGMAGAGQVIYLTHHRHLCDIARAVCPSVRLHSLGDQGVADLVA